MSEINTELDYQKKPVSYPQYRMNKILPQNGSQNVTITGGGGQQSVFEIPAVVYNLAKSKLVFTLTPTAAGAGVANWFPKDCISAIQAIQLYTRSGVYLCDVQYANTYTQLVNPIETKLQEFLDYDLGGNATIHDNVCRGLQRSNALGSSTTSTVASPFAVRYDDSAATVNYTEKQYCESGTLNTADPVIHYQLPLEHIKNSLFGCDKDLYMGESIILRITWAAVNRIGFTTTDVTSPATGAAAMTADIALSNLALFLSVEKNQAIINSLMAKVSSGFSMAMPYIHGYKTNLNGTSQNVSLRFNRGHGQRLVKLYHTLYHNTETANTAYNHDNIGDAKVLSYYTALNNNRIQEFNVDTSEFEDYLIHEQMLKGSVIQCCDMYQYNWFHCDSWSPDNVGSKDLFNNIVGLSLDVEQKWDGTFTTANAQHNHFSFAIVQRELVVSPAGIIVQ